jgi:hypothetical protein
MSWITAVSRANKIHFGEAIKNNSSSLPDLSALSHLDLVDGVEGFFQGWL